jgi:hypothetical protein
MINQNGRFQLDSRSNDRDRTSLCIPQTKSPNSRRQLSRNGFVLIECDVIKSLQCFIFCFKGQDLVHPDFEAMIDQGTFNLQVDLAFVLLSCDESSVLLVYFLFTTSRNKKKEKLEKYLFLKISRNSSTYLLYFVRKETVCFLLTTKMSCAFHN